MSDKKNLPCFFDEIYDVKLLYLEIMRGYSYDFDNKIYIKHFSELEKIEIIDKRQEIYKTLISKGVKTDKEAIEYLISESLWTSEREDEISFLEVTIDDNVKQADLIISPSQKKVVLGLVEKDKDKLGSIKKERAELVGLTAERYADEKYLNYYLYYSFYKDKELKERFFSEADFKNLEELEVSHYFGIYGGALKNFEDKNFKKISASPFFLNSISFSYENPRLFLDKAYNEYTSYQLDLFHLGKRNVKVLSESTANPPVIHSKTLFQDLVNWYDLQYVVNENHRKEESGTARGSVKSSVKNH